MLYVLTSACDANPPVDVANKIVGATALGETLWAQACPVEIIDGVCGQRAARPNLVTCASVSADAGEAPLAIVARDPNKVQAAMAAFTEARTQFDNDRAELLTDPAAVAAYQAARRMLLAPAYETYLGLHFPTDLNFDPAAPLQLNASMNTFAAWFQQKSSTGQELRESFDDINDIGMDEDPLSNLRSAAIFKNFAADIMHGEIPVSVRTGEFATEKIRAYCDAFESQAQKLRAGPRP